MAWTCRRGARCVGLRSPQRGSLWRLRTWGRLSFKSAACAGWYMLPRNRLLCLVRRIRQLFISLPEGPNEGLESRNR